MRLKGRRYLCNMKVHGEAASADVEAAVSNPEDLAQTVHESEYTKQPIFSTDEAAFC